MLIGLAVLLAIAWLLGFVVFHVASAAIHVLIALAVVALLWVSARIYRIGILSTGRRPTLREVWQWVRTG
jgi:hypothetical protein